LSASEARYRRLFETAKDGILILDAKTGRITDSNPFLEEMLGYTHAELLGKRLWELGPFKDITASQVAFQELQTNEYIRYENLPTGQRGHCRQVEFISNLYLVDSTKVIQCNIRDITGTQANGRASNKRMRHCLWFRLATATRIDLLNRMNDLLQTCETQRGPSGHRPGLDRALPWTSGCLALFTRRQYLETVAHWETKV
jgi:PAS domain S-box-containing protein